MSDPRRRRFATIERTLTAPPNHPIVLTVVADMEVLVEELSELDADERLPYWARLWPSGEALLYHLRDRRLEGPVLELGSGMGLVAVGLAKRGLEVCATDYEADALHFVATNAERNRVGDRVRTALLDWRSREAIGAFPTIVAADVLYEERKIEPLLATIEQNLAPNGRAFIADPKRGHLPLVQLTLKARGWVVETRTHRDISLLGCRRG